MSSYIRRRWHLLKTHTRAIRDKRSPKLLSFIKHQAAGKALVFVVKKKFKVDAEVDRRNSRVIHTNLLWRPTCVSNEESASLIVFGATASNRRVMNLHFIAVTLKIGTKEYLDILKTSLLLWMKQKFGLDNVVLIQDSVPTHSSKATQVFLGKKV